LRLKNPKNECSVTIFLLEIKKTKDSLDTIGAPVSIEYHVETILDGFSADFDPFVASIMSQKNLTPSMRLKRSLAQEECLSKTIMLIISPFLLVLMLLSGLLRVQLLKNSRESLFTLVVAVTSCVAL